MLMSGKHLETLEHKDFSVLTPFAAFSQHRGVVGKRQRGTLEVSIW